MSQVSIYSSRIF